MNKQLRNLIHLRDVVFPQVFELDKRGLVDFDSFESACGTYRCLGGWDYVLTTGERRVTDEITLWLQGRYGVKPWTKEYIPLFGCTQRGTLQDRYDYLCQLIDERLAEEIPDFQAMAQRQDLLEVVNG